MRQQPRPVDPQTILIAHLEAQEWNVTIGALHKLPYELVARIIGKLRDQLMQQHEPPPPPDAGTPPEAPNG